MKRAKEHTLLLERFISCFPKHDEMIVFPEIDPIAVQLSVGQPDEYGYLRWEPKRAATDFSELNHLYEKLPARFPPLFEELVLDYRWAEIDLRMYRLLPNPPGPDFSGLFLQISGDPAFWELLPQNGYLQFGRGSDADYDPVCFDLSARKQNGEYAIVKIDHEEILCNHRIKIVQEMAASFRDLVLQTIKDA